MNEDTEALVKVLDRSRMTAYDDGTGGHLFRGASSEEQASAILASDWLANYVAARLAAVEAALLTLAATEDYDPWASAIITNDAVKAVRAAVAAVSSEAPA